MTTSTHAVEPVTPGWRLASMGLAGSASSVSGLDPWKEPWRMVDAFIVVADPSNPQVRHRADLYEMGEAGRDVLFAATDLLHGVWAFYVPESPGLQGLREGASRI